MWFITQCFGVGFRGAPEIYWIWRKTLFLFVIQLRCAVSCKRNVNGCLIPTGRLVMDARKRYISSIYWLYSCHMTTSFHLYTDSILVIWLLHSIYIPTLFLSYDDFIPPGLVNLRDDYGQDGAAAEQLEDGPRRYRRRAAPLFRVQCEPDGAAGRALIYPAASGLHDHAKLQERADVRSLMHWTRS